MPLMRETYRQAHALTGNRELAEMALQDALLTAFVHRKEYTLRDGLRWAVVNAALDILREARRKGPVAVDWNGFSGDVPPPAEMNHARALLEGESVRVCRIFALKHGCGLRFAEIAEIMETRASIVRKTYGSACTRLERALSRRRGRAVGSARHKE